MLIAARNAMMVGGGWKNPYVTDGLVAMWDGEWNAGGGVHDPNATVWKNLVVGSPFGDGIRSGSALTTGLPLWTEKSCYSPERNTALRCCFYVSAPYEATLGVLCGETVARVKESKDTSNGAWNTTAVMGLDMRMDWGYQDDYLVAPAAVFTYTAERYQYWMCGLRSWLTALSPLVLRSYHIERHGDTLSCQVNNGSSIANLRKSNGMTEPIPTSWMLVTNTRAIMEVFNIRYYSRALTADEIAANYAVDKARFNLPDAS